MKNNNFQITTLKLETLSKENFKKDLEQRFNSKGKFFYQLYPNQKLREQTGLTNRAFYLGKSEDIADRLYRHFKGMSTKFAYSSSNMEKGRRIYAMMSPHCFDIPEYMLENLYKYINVELHDLTETDIDLDCYEAQQIKSFKRIHNTMPVLQKREEPTIVGNLARSRRFFGYEEEVKV